MKEIWIFLLDITFVPFNDRNIKSYKEKNFGEPLFVVQGFGRRIEVIP